MARRKSNKEYAIQIEHDVLGTFYYKYVNVNSGYRTKHKFIFVKSLKKVKTWKTKEWAEKFIKDIPKLTNNKFLLLQLTKDEYDNITDNKIKSKIEKSKEKYYLKIYNPYPEHIYKLIDDSLKKLEIDIKNINIKINTLILNNNFNVNTHLDNLKELCNKYNKEIKLKEIYETYNKNIKIKIVDASYNFRKLKIENLNKKT